MRYYVRALTEGNPNLRVYIVGLVIAVSSVTTGLFHLGHVPKLIWAGAAVVGIVMMIGSYRSIVQEARSRRE